MRENVGGDGGDLSAEAILSAFERVGGGTVPLSTEEVAAGAGAEAEAVAGELSALSDRGLLRSKRVGKDGRVWWLGDAPRSRTGRVDAARGASERLVASLLETTPVGVAIHAAGGSLVELNPRGRELLDRAGTAAPDGADASTGDGLALDWTVVGGPDAGASLVDAVVASDAPRYDVQATAAAGADASRTFDVGAVPVRGAGGTVDQVIVTFGAEDAPARVAARLRRLARLVATIRTIVGVVVESSDRETLERRLCHRLVEYGPYALAWVGRVNWVSETVTPVEWARTGASTGDADSDADADGGALAPEVDATEGPSAEVVRRRDVRVVADLTRADPALDDGWRREALALGYRSMANVPFVYEGRLYGSVTVYSTESGVFGSGTDATDPDVVPVLDEHATVLSELGSTVGHAISALERRDALLGDEFVEATFRSRALSARFGGDLAPGVRVTADRAVRVAEGSVVLFVRVSGVEPDEYRDALASRPAVTDVRIVAADDDGFRASVTTSGESLTDVFATHGGRLASVDVEGGVLDVVANLPRSVDVQAVREALRDRYPDVELVDYRTGARVRPSARGFRGTVEDDLTDKQWTALELAHRGGYFAWPRRDSDASDLADAMGITPQTFHEHLRKAQRALVSSFFEAGEEEPDDAR